MEILLLLLVFLGAIYGILYLIVVAAGTSRAAPRPDKPSLSSTLLTPCPFCEEFVSLGATHCQSCGRSLGRRKRPASPRE